MDKGLNDFSDLKVADSEQVKFAFGFDLETLENVGVQAECPLSKICGTRNSLGFTF